MKRIITGSVLVGLFLFLLYAASQVAGPNQYAARIAEAQADLETARALQDQAQAIQTIAGGLNRVAFGQTVILLVLVLAGVALVGFVVYVRFSAHAPMPTMPKAGRVLPAAPVAGLPDGLQGVDPALVNQMITLEILKALRGMNAPQLPEDVRRNGHEGR